MVGDDSEQTGGPGSSPALRMSCEAQLPTSNQEPAKSRASTDKATKEESKIQECQEGRQIAVLK